MSTPPQRADEATPAPFYSVLYADAQQQADAPVRDLHETFHDLLLDSIFDAAYAAYAPQPAALWQRGQGHGDADFAAALHAGLHGLFAAPLTDVAAVRARQAVLRDLHDARIEAAFVHWRAAMAQMRRCLRLSTAALNAIEGQRWFLDAVRIHDDALATLDDALVALSPQAILLQALRRDLSAYLQQPDVRQRRAETAALLGDLGALRYGLRLEGGTVSVLHDPGQQDYSAALARCFARFARHAVRDYHATLPRHDLLDSVESRILDRVAQLHPQLFDRLQRFCGNDRNFTDERWLRLDRELPFYLGWIGFERAIAPAGALCCIPQITPEPGAIVAAGACDMALAHQAVQQQQRIVANDYALSGQERRIVITGPNHGGKTTLARSIGQMHHLAALGLSIAAAQASLLLTDRIHTHFEREEDTATLHGKLQDDLLRVRHILDDSSARTLVLLNELFSSTSSDDAAALARRVLERLRTIGAVTVFVTFLAELAAGDAQTVSMVAEVDSADPTVRTYRVTRRAADGRSHARALATKYGVTAEALLQRIAP